MPSGQEIITLQLGHYSNFIGTHWWNIQEAGFDYNSEVPSEINHDVLLREGRTLKDEVTFTPRMLLVDLKGSLNTVSERGDLYDDQEIPDINKLEWAGDVDLKQVPRGEKNEYLKDLEEEEQALQRGDVVGAQSLIGSKKYELNSVVKVWSDYLRPRFHPKSVTIINDYCHGSDSRKFDIFNLGTNLWKTEMFEEDFCDRIRNYAEECDNLQGFHMLVDCYDGFGGLGVSALQHIEDEYSSKTTLAFPVLPAAYEFTGTLADSIRTVNTALCFRGLSEHAPLFAPLCMGSQGWRQPGPPREFKYLNYNALLPYHTSAILAVALDTLTMRHRLRSKPQERLSTLANALGRLGRRATAVKAGIPFPLAGDGDAGFLLEALEAWDGPLWHSLSPSCGDLEAERIWMQSVVLRGVGQERLKSPTSMRKNQDGNPAYSCTTVEEMLKLFLYCCSYATASHVTSASQPCNVGAPFPHIFSEDIGIDGFLYPKTRSNDIGVSSIPVIAGLHSCRSVGTMLESLHSEAARLRINKLHGFGEAGLEEDEYKECIAQLADFRECYHEEFDV
ncbi:protein misato homolog 1 [Hetaerina americana]|uniref:protein misato homolog 1 n=1 Tax=Hetaerina americana TaxID=62018 RepID=UPI003A7F1B16